MAIAGMEGSYGAKGYKSAYVSQKNETVRKRNAEKPPAQDGVAAKIEKENNVDTFSFSEKMEPEYANYTKETLAGNAVEDKNTFPDCNIFKKYEKYFKVLNEHYAKVNEENKKFANPEQHIKDKYYNKNSPYYVQGLTQVEREICVRAESDVLKGIPPALSSGNPVIQENFGGCNIFMMDMEYNQEIREEMNDAIHQAFVENGIIIPKDADLKLTVDPYDFLIHADGVDEELSRRIEAVLNQGKNGYSLYNHITLCNPVNYGVQEPLQYISGNKDKMVVYHFVNRLTGYDIRELENRDGKFYTPEGVDLWEVLEDKYHELAADGKAEASVLGEYKDAYQKIAKAGWNRTTDCNLSIIYQDGSLVDMDTSYGYGPGQTAWQDRVRSWYDGIQEEYLRKREETHRREENTPTKLEMAVKETEQRMEEMFGWKNTSALQGANVRLISPDLPALQKLLDRLQKDGMLDFFDILGKK